MRTLKISILFISILLTVFHLFVSVSTSISMMQMRVIHLFFMILMWILINLEKRKKLIINSIFLFISSTLFIFYFLSTSPDVIREKGIWGINLYDVIAGTILIFMILTTAKQTMGWSLPIISIVFLMYAFIGPYLPQLIAHRGYDLEYLVSYLAWTNEGIFGTAIGAAVSFVVLYIIFGEMLDKFGAGKFFIDLAYALTGKMRGGPAEAAVLSSAMMGSINGSAVANVVTTGTFTIPLMKKVGYSSEYAGAVEAVASTGGQILPPVMGAAAFVMADLTGIAYSTIIIGALIPGLLYYISLGAAVYFEAGRLGIKPEKSEKLQKARTVLKGGYYYLIPLVILIVALIGFGLSASFSAIFAIVSILLIGTIKVWILDKRLPIKELKAIVLNVAKSSVPVSIACASAGIVIGIVSMSGLGVRFAQIVFDLSNGNLFFMLLLTMLACIILGMGLPSTAAFVISATVAAPALLQAGVPELSANLFVFYFAIISFITPPVAMSAYAASGIAKSDSIQTGLQAFKLGIAGFIIPFYFVYRPSLLILGTPFLDTLYSLLLALSSVLLIAIAFEGWCFIKINTVHRIILLINVVLLVLVNNIFNIIGLILVVLNITWIVFKYIKEKDKQ